MEAKHTPISVGSRWASKANSATVYVVLERKPFGRLEVQMEGRLIFGETTCKRLRANCTELDKAPSAVTEPPDLDAWECRECCGQGSVTRLHKVTHQLGTDLMPLDDECEECDGLGYCGPDAEERAKVGQ